MDASVPRVSGRHEHSTRCGCEGMESRGNAHGRQQQAGRQAEQGLSVTGTQAGPLQP